MPSCPLTASVDLLHILLRYAMQLGIDEQSISSECGFDVCTLRSNETRIPMNKFNRIWAVILNRSNDPDFGLHFGAQSHNFLKRHLLYAMMMNCENVEQAIRKNFKYHQLIIDAIQPMIRIEKTVASLTWKYAHQELKNQRHLSESVLVLLISMLRYLTENKIRIKEVRFTHRRPQNTTEQDHFFQSPLLFNQKNNKILLLKDSLNLPILPSNPLILNDLEQLVQKALHRAYTAHSWSEKVAHMISKAVMQEENMDIKTIAQHFAMTTRNLQFKLKNEGASYRKILDEVRKKTAISFLQDNNTSICEIALLLGFADQSAFSHAFKRWTGKTPGNSRKKM